MRVTDRQIFENAARAGGQARSRFEAASKEASSGLRVESPEDDPAAASLISQTVADSGRFEAMGKAMSEAADELQAADIALDGVSMALSRARELAVQLANATYDANQRAAGAAEIDALFQHVVGQLNTRVGQRYLFGGFQDQAPPFDAAGTYLGDTGVRQVELASGVLLPASVRADVALTGSGGGVDVLGTLKSLSTALATNDVNGVQSTLNELDTGIAQVASLRAEAGSSVAVLDAAGAVSQAAKTAAQIRLSHLADADVIESATKLAQAERALDATLSAAAKSFRPTLLDKL